MVTILREEVPEFNPYLPSVELSCTALNAVSGTMSNSNRHVILNCSMLVYPKLPLCSGVVAFEV